MSLTEFHDTANVAAKGCLERLLSSFPGLKERPLAGSIGFNDPKILLATYYHEQGQNPLIGVELEVRFSSFFPEIARKFFTGRTYYDLTEDEKQEVSRMASERELTLRPLLEAGLACGLGRGRDRYWEHVLPPTTSPGLTCELVNAMIGSGLLPHGKHPLHLTVGSVKPSRLLYFALLALELTSCDRERILAGFNQEDRTKPAGWAKKGRAGVFSKVDWGLKYEDSAVELRTLYLDTRSYVETIWFAFKLGRALKKGYGAEYEQLIEFAEFASSVLEHHGLPDSNWLKPSQNPEVWQKFADNFESIKALLRDDLRALMTEAHPAGLQDACRNVQS